jgi:sensor c-di-GMP phosphodiesterase-like protein
MLGMRRGLRYAGLLAALAAGIAAAAVLAAAGSAQDTTTETTTTVQTTTEPTTVVQTATVEETRTRILTVPATTTSGEQGSGETPTWVWVLVGALAVGLIAAVIALVARRRGSGAEQRQRQLHGAMNSWVAQGWAVESETSDSAVLRRGAERMLVTVDADGHVATRTLQ